MVNTRPMPSPNGTNREGLTMPASRVSMAQDAAEHAYDVVDGLAADGGIMTRIAGNHCALVEEGRAGPQCVVGDGMVRPPAYRDFIARFPNAERFL